MKKLLFVFICAAFASCGNHYSPLDNYINAVNAGTIANDSMRLEAQKYIDSVNAAHIIIHNKRKF